MKLQLVDCTRNSVFLKSELGWGRFDEVPNFCLHSYLVKLFFFSSAFVVERISTVVVWYKEMNQFCLTKRRRKRILIIIMTISLLLKFPFTNVCHFLLYISFLCLLSVGLIMNNVFLVTVELLFSQFAKIWLRILWKNCWFLTNSCIKIPLLLLTKSNFELFRSFTVNLNLFASRTRLRFKQQNLKILFNGQSWRFFLLDSITYSNHDKHFKFLPQIKSKGKNFNLIFSFFHRIH